VDLSQLVTGSTAVATTTSAASASPCPDITHVDFWAVGMDCCDDAGSFKCFPDGQQFGRAGLIVRDSREEEMGLFPDKTTMNYKQVALLAAAKHDFPESDRIMLLRWGSDFEAARSAYYNEAVRTIVLTAAIAFFVLALVANGGLALIFGSHRDQRKNRKRSEEDPSPARSAGGASAAVSNVQEPASPKLPPPQTRRRREL